MEQTKKRKSIIFNALVLTSGAIICKIIGFIYQIYLYRYVSLDHMYTYTSSMNIYNILLLVSVGGIPIAISKLMAEEFAKNRDKIAYKIFRVTLIMTTSVAVLAAVLLFFGAPFFARLLSNPSATFVIRALSPTIIVVTWLGVVRGYFQSRENMVPTSESQILEQIGRVIFSVLIVMLVSEGIGAVSDDLKIINGIAFGPLVGAILGLGLLIILIFLEKRKSDEPYKILFFKEDSLSVRVSNNHILRKILAISIPITIASILPGLIDLVDNTLIVRTLVNSGLSHEVSRVKAGAFLSFSIQLINIVTLIGSSFGRTMVPSISIDRYNKDYNLIRSKVKNTIKTVSVINIAAASGLFFLSNEITKIVMGTGNDVATSSKVLQACTLMVIFMGMYYTTTGILQGLSKIYIPMIALGVALVLEAILVFTLMTYTGLGIYGAVIAHTISYLVANLINLAFLKRHLGYKSNSQVWLPRITLAAVGMGVVSFLVYKVLGFLLFMKGETFAFRIVDLFLTIIISGFVYLIFLGIFKVFTTEEMENIPKLGKVLLKIHRRVYGDKRTRI